MTNVSPLDQDDVGHQAGGVLLPHGIYRKFKQATAAKETTISDLCRAWVEEAPEILPKPKDHSADNREHYYSQNTLSASGSLIY